MNTIKSKFIKWITTSHLFALPRRYAGMIAMYIIAIRRTHTFYLGEENSPLFNILKKIKKETELLLNDFEAHQIYMAVRATEKIPGDIAEVGVYKGGSAMLICETAKKKSIHLFDTFEGLPDLCGQDSHKQFKKGDYFALFKTVKNTLKKYHHVHFYKGFFPDTATPVKNKKFSFVHLDVDIYESTSSCLKFFYPRMSAGGVIISHDYPGSAGVKRAFDEFFKDKKETIVDLPVCGQCLVVKV